MPTTKLWTCAEIRPVDFETGWLVGIGNKLGMDRGSRARSGCAYPSETTRKGNQEGTFGLSWVGKS